MVHLGGTLYHAGGESTQELSEIGVLNMEVRSANCSPWSHPREYEPRQDSHHFWLHLTQVMDGPLVLANDGDFIDSEGRETVRKGELLI